MDARMKLPTVKGRTNYYPRKPLCPWCRRGKVLEPHSFAILGGGALLVDRRNDYGGPSDSMEGFLYVSWHGAHDRGLGKDREIGATVELANDVRGGQFDLYFCSTKCLRSYLNYCVDALERKLRLERNRIRKRPKESRTKARRVSTR